MKKHVKFECNKEPSFLCSHCTYRTFYFNHLQTHVTKTHEQENKSPERVDSKEPIDYRTIRVKPMSFFMPEAANLPLPNQTVSNVKKNALEDVSFLFCDDKVVILNWKIFIEFLF